MSDYSELKRLATEIQSCKSIKPSDEAAWMRRTTGEKVLLALEEIEESESEIYSLKKTATLRDDMRRAFGYSSWREFQSDMEALRKDAERYRWLNSEAACDSGMIPEFDGEKWSVIYLDNGAGGFGGVVCTAVFGSANEAVDFAMSKGAKP